MKVIALNGSPRPDNNTGQLLQVVCSELHKEGFETEIINIAKPNYSGCIACGGCRTSEDGLCIIQDGFADLQRKVRDADGLLIGTPVYYAGVSGQTKSVLDRLFYSPGVSKSMKYKPGAAVLAVRRGGALPAYHTINTYFGITGMFTVGSTYWNFAIGRAPGQCLEDAEGLRNMQDIGQNMAYLLKKLNQ